MIEESVKRYKIYEYIRDNEKITSEMSNTKKIIVKLMAKNVEIEKFCEKKVKEEWQEVEEAKSGIHFHKAMSKREILVNEISQYIYWLTVIAISKKMTYKDFDVENKINEILDKIDIAKIGEKKKITLEEIIEHDMKDMRKKEYFMEVIG